MAVTAKVRERMWKFFNPESFDGLSCRSMLIMGLNGCVLTELVVYTMLQHSADLGELPQYIAGALIIGIASMEVLLAPLLCWLGARRRRSVMVGWTLLALVTNLPLFALPEPGITQDASLCSSIAPCFPTGIATGTAVRLSLLLISGLSCALARSAIVGHGLAYINEHTPSVNLHMHVGVIVIYRIVIYGLGRALKTRLIQLPWLQLVLNLIQFLIMLIRLHSYPEVAPRVEKLRQNDEGSGLFCSMGRVLSRGVVVLLILAMGLLTAAWWGFGMHEPVFVQMKYNFRPDIDSLITAILRMLSVILGVLLAGYMYTMPIMPKYDRKAVVYNAARMTMFSTLLYILLIELLSCRHGSIAGGGETYIQPACGQSCGCDRPWMDYSPVCESEQLTTYFSPCHAGCTSTEVVNNVHVYSNCTCAPGGRLTIGPCADGSCDGAYSLHQMLFLLVVTCNTLALVWVITVVLETVDKRDVAVALGIISSVIALFTFVAGHAFYMGISSFTCAFNLDSKCLLQNSRFVPWVGYSSACLTCLAFILIAIAYVVLKRQKDPNDEDPNVHGDYVIHHD